MLIRNPNHRYPMKATVPSLMTIAALTLTLCAHASAARHHWFLETVDPMVTSGSIQMAVDSAGRTHLAYGQSALYYDRLDSHGWIRECVDPGATPSGISCCLDAVGKPRFAYIDSVTREVRYASRWMHGWHVEVLAHDAFVTDSPWDQAGMIVAIAIDRAGYTHVAYRSGSVQRSSLSLLSQTSSGWQRTEIAQWSRAYWGHIRLAISAGDRPHIFCHSPDGQILAREGVGGWAIDIVARHRHLFRAAFGVDARIHVVGFDLEAGQFQYVGVGDDFHESHTMGTSVDLKMLELVVDGTDSPWVMIGGGDNNLRLHTKRDGDWNSLIVPESSSTDWAVLSVDSQGDPHLWWRYNSDASLIPSQDAEIRCATFESGRWRVSKSHPVIPAQLPSVRLALTALHVDDDRAWITMSHPDAGSMHHWKDEQGWHSRTLASPQLVIQGLQMKIDSSGAAHIVYRVGVPRQSEVKYAVRDAQGWNTSRVSDVTFYWHSCDLALDSNGDPHLVFGGDTLQYATRQGPRWSTTTLLSVPVKVVAISLDGMGRPHVLAQGQQPHSEAHSWELVYLWLDEEEWRQEVVTTINSYDPIDLQVKVDPMGRPQIVYYNREEHLAHAARTTEGWDITTIDPRPMAGWFVSLALDAEGEPHVVYGATQHLYHATRTRSEPEWIITSLETKLSQYASEGSVSVGFGPDGTMHMAYIGESASVDPESVLILASKVEADWHFEVIGSWPFFVSLATDASGLHHIAYMDRWQDAVVYLHTLPLAFTRLTPLSGRSVRLEWQGALEGVGVDRAASINGPWVPIAENLLGLECVVDAPEPSGFFRLRRDRKP
jgi:hypothetical protein